MTGRFTPLAEPKFALYVFWTAERNSAGQVVLFSALLRQGSSLHPSDEPSFWRKPRVIHRLGVLIALGTLLAINLAGLLDLVAKQFVVGSWTIQRIARAE
jgi:hypothetical protein